MSDRDTTLSVERPRSIPGNSTMARMGRFALHLETLPEHEARAALTWVTQRLTDTWLRRRRGEAGG